MDSRTDFEASLKLNYDKVFEFLSTKYNNLLKSTPLHASDTELKTKQRYKEYRYVAAAFFKLYESKRTPDQNSTSTLALWGIQKAASFLINTKTTAEVISHIKGKIVSAIDTVESLLDVLKLIITLRKYAELSQNKKYTSGPALLFLTLHAIAGYLIDSCQKDFEPLITALKDELQQLEQNLDDDYLHNNGKEIERLNNLRLNVINALAFLNEFVGVNNAKLPYYQLPNDDMLEKCKYFKSGELKLNLGTPLVYQKGKGCYLFVYETEYRPDQNESFDEFSKKAKAEGIVEEQKATAKSMTSNTIDYDLIYTPAEWTGETKKLPGEAPFAYLITPKGIWYINKADNSSEPINVPQEELQALLSQYKLTNQNDTNTQYVAKLTEPALSNLETKRRAKTNGDTQILTVALNNVH